MTPLNHVEMALTLQHAFQYAYQQVLVDEYGAENMKSVPIAGLGHSLGARLLVVLATLMTPSSPLPLSSDNTAKDATARTSRRQRSPASSSSSSSSDKLPYKAMILISFINFAADTGIPGISPLAKERYKLDQREKRQKQQAQQQRRRRRRGSYNDNGMDEEDVDEEDYDDWGEIWNGLTEVLQQGADRIKSQWTPQARDLEFFPTPRSLWKALNGTTTSGTTSGGNGSRYNIPQTLLIQFDRDVLDQSAKLATVLMNKNTHQQSSSSTTTATTTTDLKFARLRGTHLTPVTLPPAIAGSGGRTTTTNGGGDAEGWLRQWSTKSTRALWKSVQGTVVGGRPDGGNMSQEEALRDLRQTIVRYISDIVTK